MIEAETMQQRRVPVVMMNDILDRVMAPFIGLAVNVAALETAAGDPLTKAVRVVIAPAFLAAGVVLQNRQPAHFAAPMNDRRVKQAALLQVLDQRRAGLSIATQLAGRAVRSAP